MSPRGGTSGTGLEPKSRRTPSCRTASTSLPERACISGPTRRFRPAPGLLELIRTETGLPEGRLGLPVDASGIDSFDLITLRTFLEEKRGRAIPDAQWAGIATLEDIARLPALRDRTAPALPRAQAA